MGGIIITIIIIINESIKCAAPHSQNPAIPQRILQDRLLDRSKDESDVPCIRSLCEMRENAEPCAIRLREPPEDVFCCLVYICSSRVLWEKLGEGYARDLLFEDVDFVQEKDDRCA